MYNEQYGLVTGLFRDYYCDFAERLSRSIGTPVPQKMKGLCDKGVF